MKYSVKQLARAYCEYLSNQGFDVRVKVSQPYDLATYN